MSDTPSQPGSRPEGQSFGARLRAERELREVTLADIALRTKVHTRYLSAIEENRFDQCPGGVFTRNFLRSYAKVLGLDSEQVLLDYQVELQLQGAEKEPDLLKPIKVLAEDGSTKKRDTSPLWLLVLFLVIGGLMAALGYLSSQKTKAGPKNKNPTPTISTPQEKTKANQPEHAEPITPPVLSNLNQDPSAAIGEKQNGLHLAFAGSCWVELKVDNALVAKRTLMAGQELTYNGNRFQVVLGDPAQVKASYNGRDLDLKGVSGKRYQATWSAKQLQDLTQEP